MDTQSRGVDPALDRYVSDTLAATKQRDREQAARTGAESALRKIARQARG